MDPLQSGHIHGGGRLVGRLGRGAFALLGLCVGSVGAATGWAASGAGVRTATAGAKGGPASAWAEALQARRQFEAEPVEMHTREAYEHVMNQFRVIYRDDPGDEHAAAAVEAVAELFAQRGRELHDGKSLAAAVGQYEYLAKAYPGDTLAPVALKQALRLLGSEAVPGAGNDSANEEEAKKIRTELAEDYPQSGREAGAGSGAGAGVEAGEDHTAAGWEPAASRAGAEGPAGTQTGSSGVGQSGDERNSDDSVPQPDPAGVVAGVSAPREGATAERKVAKLDQREPGAKSGPLAVVTGIRHWSTSSYTRVAIDLNVAPGQEVKYEAARVEHPDRIFFDLEDARLGDALVGKSITVTDDGFLKRVRAAQFKGDVTRVVLDVHQVTAYSAFCLPNPYRLIIDIHGDPGGQQTSQTPDAMRGAGTSPAAAQAGEVAVAQVERAPGTAGSGGGVEISSLPAMPVTDGRASFALPKRSVKGAGVGTGSGAGYAARPVAGLAAEFGRPDLGTVTQPQVVKASKAVVARSAADTAVRSAAESDAEVADVSRQPGMVEATRQPTSKPIAEISRELGVQSPQAQRSRANAAAVAKGGPVTTAEVKGTPAPVPPPTSAGETSLMRTLGLKIGRIVIDAGHGGHDSGTLGAGGIEEKDVVLDVALRLGKLLHERLGADVVYTRDDDTFVPLETRTAIANKAQADLFISVHANSSRDPSVSGVEVYYLNFTSDPEAMMVAARENAVSTQSVHELSDLVKKIALQDKIDESRELATDVDASLYAGQRRGNSGLKNRGVKKAPFVVLIGANMPSILAEIDFVTNPKIAAELETPQYRERVAESLYRGIARYAEGVNGVRPKVETVEQAQR